MSIGDNSMSGYTPEYKALMALERQRRLARLLNIPFVEPEAPLVPDPIPPEPEIPEPIPPLYAYRDGGGGA